MAKKKMVKPREAPAPAGARDSPARSAGWAGEGGLRPPATPARRVGGRGGAAQPSPSGGRGAPTLYNDSVQPPVAAAVTAAGAAAAGARVLREVGGAHPAGSHTGLERPVWWVGVDDTRIGNKIIVAFVAFYSSRPPRVVEPKLLPAGRLGETEKTIYLYLKRLSARRKIIVYSSQRELKERLVPDLVTFISSLPGAGRGGVAHVCNLGFLSTGRLLEQLILRYNTPGGRWRLHLLSRWELRVSRPGEVLPLQAAAAYFARAYMMRMPYMR